MEAFDPLCHLTVLSSWKSLGLLSPAGLCVSASSYEGVRLLPAEVGSRQGQQLAVQVSRWLSSSCSGECRCSPAAALVVSDNFQHQLG
eukprot:114304-Pelagomonas_calceolata.AAC.1